MYIKSSLFWKMIVFSVAPEKALTFSPF